MKPGEFEALFRSYYPRVYRRLYYLLGERAAAEDLTQEVFLKLYRKPPRDESNLGGWLSRVAANLAYNYLRGEERRRCREERQVRGAQDPSRVILLEEAIVRGEEARQVHSCLARLSPRERLSLLLRNVGYSYAEIAAAIEVDKSSVGTILARARRHFAALYQQYQGRDDHATNQMSKGGPSPGLS
ncbi:MAG: sigma-70 family RNA polymerase sigma factor [Clostridia bacterium]|nr:sigma-70 family RNA polymerase sigma factor [Clostridia bacterium]